MVWRNFDILWAAGHNADVLADLIDSSLPKGATHIRIHVGGDYYNFDYYLAWMRVAQRHPEIIFYGYTKMIPFIKVTRPDMPANFRITASIGGRYDEMAYQYPVYARIVYSQQEADDLGLEIDHDDSHAIDCTKPYAIIIHGTQPAGSVAGKAVAAWRKLMKKQEVNNE